jgi:hypothetical protein
MFQGSKAKPGVGSGPQEVQWSGWVRSELDSLNSSQHFSFLESGDRTIYAVRVSFPATMFLLKRSSVGLHSKSHCVGLLLQAQAETAPASNFDFVSYQMFLAYGRAGPNAPFSWISM